MDGAHPGKVECRENSGYKSDGKSKDYKYRNQNHSRRHIQYFCRSDHFEKFISKWNIDQSRHQKGTKAQQKCFNQELRDQRFFMGTEHFANAYFFKAPYRFGHCEVEVVDAGDNDREPKDNEHLVRGEDGLMVGWVVDGCIALASVGVEESLVERCQVRLRMESG